MKTGYAVADAMTTKPVTVPSSLTVRQASGVMREHEVGSLLVVDDGTLVGIIIAEDIVHRVTGDGKKSSETMICDVMTTEIIDILPEADLYDAMQIMQEHDIFHLPVRDSEKRLVGFLTLKDVLRIEPQLFELMSEMAELSQPRNGHSSSVNTEGYCEECGNFSTMLYKKGKKKVVCSVCAGIE